MLLDKFSCDKYLTNIKYDLVYIQVKENETLKEFLDWFLRLARTL